jgi:hypothetical protein
MHRTKKSKKIFLFHEYGCFLFSVRLLLVWRGGEKWARPELNRRSPRCKRDVITTRPLAQEDNADSDIHLCFKWFSGRFYQMTTCQAIFKFNFGQQVAQVKVSLRPEKMYVLYNL